MGAAEQASDGRAVHRRRQRGQQASAVPGGASSRRGTNAAADLHARGVGSGGGRRPPGPAGTRGRRRTAPGSRPGRAIRSARASAPFSRGEGESPKSCSSRTSVTATTARTARSTTWSDTTTTTATSRMTSNVVTLAALPSASVRLDSRPAGVSPRPGTPVPQREEPGRRGRTDPLRAPAEAGPRARVWPSIPLTRTRRRRGGLSPHAVHRGAGSAGTPVHGGHARDRDTRSDAPVGPQAPTTGCPVGRAPRRSCSWRRARPPPRARRGAAPAAPRRRRRPAGTRGASCPRAGR